MSLGNGLPILVIISKNELLVIKIFTIIPFISFSFVSALIFLISFLLTSFFVVIVVLFLVALVVKLCCLFDVFLVF